MDGDIDQADYRQEKAKIEAQLTAREQADEGAILRKLTSANGTSADCGKARCEFVASLIAAVWCDLDGRRVVAVQVHDDLRPLCEGLATYYNARADEPDTRVVLHTAAHQDGDAVSGVMRTRRDSNPRSPA